MNRVIKFRAWDIKNKQMHEVREISFDANEIIIKRSYEKIQELEKAGQDYCHNCDNISDDLLNFDECELMQYTGLLDKNGNKIYEDDILLGKFEINDIVDNLWLSLTIKEREEGSKIYIVESIFFFHEIPVPADIEIIGNIYENPKLFNEHKSSSDPK